MRTIFILTFIFLSVNVFAQLKKPCLTAFVDSSSRNKLYGYKASNGRIIIPAKYYSVYSDKLCNYAIVVTKESYKWIAIDSKDSILWEAYLFDNLPDEPRNGLFRIAFDGKIGFANKKGLTVIKPVFNGAGRFSEGLAAVNVGGHLVTHGEHSFVKGGLWGYIDKEGKYVLEPQFLEAGAFENGVALVITKDGKEITINKKGKVANKKYSS